MSVTFTVHPTPTAHQWMVRCWNFDERVRSYALPNEAEADQFAVTHTSGCHSCQMFNGPLVEPESTWPEVNVSTMNASRMLRVLEFDLVDGMSGTASADSFLNRISQASRYTRQSSDLGERLALLHEIGEYAREHQLEVSWS